MVGFTSVVTIYNIAVHDHDHARTDMPYMRVRNKPYPWYVSISILCQLNFILPDAFLALLHTCNKPGGWLYESIFSFSSADLHSPFKFYSLQIHFKSNRTECPDCNIFEPACWAKCRGEEVEEH
jgi:hypothetical protein